MNLRVWAMRHAPVALSGICYGQRDVATSLDARAAADVAWPDVRGLDFARVVTSPWERTRGLATAVAQRRRLPLETDARLSELSFGEWEGRPYAEIQRHDGAQFSRWMAAWATEAPPGGETLAAMTRRVHAWLADYVAAGATRAALVVTHAGVIRILRARTRGISYATALAEPVEPLRIESFEITPLVALTPITS
jgi:alpha-ribazole phosphatase